MLLKFLQRLFSFFRRESAAPPEGTPKMDDELQQKYKKALEAIANGRSWEELIASASLDKKPSNPIKRAFAFLGNNLAAIASLAVAASGIVFGIYQYRTSNAQFEASKAQKQSELRLQQTEALNKLIPYLTADNSDTRRYATSVLFSLYTSSDPDGLKVLDDNISKVANAETLEVLAILRNNNDFKIGAAELYAVRAEHNRFEMAAADKPENYGQVRIYLNAARADADKALSLDPNNAKALYQRAVLLDEQEAATAEATRNFQQVIQLIDNGKYKMDKETYLRAHVRLTMILYREKKEPSKDVCDSFKEAKKKYELLQWDYKQEQEMATVGKACKL